MSRSDNCYEPKTLSGQPELNLGLKSARRAGAALKAKGVEALGICGAAAAIAHAACNTTGIRVRDYPITLDKLIEHVPGPV